MRKLCIMALLCLVSSMVLAEGIEYAVDSSRTSLNNGSASEADAVKSDHSKLSIRNDYKAAKSWIKFDVSGLDIGAMTSCQFRVTLNASKSSTCSVSAVNDGIGNAVDLDGSVTWNTAPGNITSADGVNPDDTVNFTVGDLQTNLDPAQTTLIGTMDYTGGLAGQQFTIDVLSILQADTDGIVLFVLHNSGGSTDFATHDHVNGSEYRPALVYETLQAGNCPGVGTLVSTYADQSCRTELFDGTNPRVDDNRGDSNKLSVRSDAKAAKSWIKFDINDLGIDPNDIRGATVRVTDYRARTGTATISAVTDDCTDNIDWTDTTLTWNNGPGNIQSSDGVNPIDTVNFTVGDLQANLDPAKTTLVGTIDYSQGSTVGDQYFFDVTSILQADTDGIVQFVLHGVNGLKDFAAHTNSGGEEYWPMLEILVAPAGADNPNPCPGETVNTDLAGLSWTNPDPNDGTSPIVCTVYLGVDPNRPQMDSITLAPDSQGVLINTTNFPTYGNLSEGDYYWVVDCYDTGADVTIDGMMWSFTVYNNQAPYNVNAGTDQWIALDSVTGVNLAGSAEDDGLPVDPGMLAYMWEQTAGPETAVIDTPNAASTSVSFTERGDYQFTFTADDSELDTPDSVRVVVGDDACDASHILDGSAYDPGDVNQDCIVNLKDYAELIAKNWLDCTNTLTGCN